MSDNTERELFGEKFDSEFEKFKQKHDSATNAEVSHLIDIMQLWSFAVFINIQKSMLGLEITNTDINSQDVDWDAIVAKMKHWQEESRILAVTKKLDKA